MLQRCHIQELATDSSLTRWLFSALTSASRPYPHDHIECPRNRVICIAPHLHDLKRRSVLAVLRISCVNFVREVRNVVYCNRVLRQHLILLMISASGKITQRLSSLTVSTNHVQRHCLELMPMDPRNVLLLKELEMRRKRTRPRWFVCVFITSEGVRQDADVIELCQRAVANRSCHGDPGSGNVTFKLFYAGRTP